MKVKCKVIIFTILFVSAVQPYRLVAYWGQNGGGNEKDLIKYCEDSAYDIIVLGFVDNFAHPRNKDEYPGINLSKHCAYTTNTDYPTLYQCPQLIPAIEQCQNNGKKVYISLGGATEEYGLKDPNQAKTFARRIWDLFLGGQDNLRPFGDAILDGVDLDIEHVKYEDYDGYPLFLQTLKSYFDKDPSRKYYVSGAPQCPYPDQNMKGVLSKTAYLFDEIFIQYYNNYCYPGGGHFKENIEKWVQYAQAVNSIKDSGRLKLFVGLPAHQKAAGKDLYFKTPKEVVDILNIVKDYDDFDGFMLWDAGFDSSNIIYSYPYSKHVKDILQNGKYNPVIPTAPPKVSEKLKLVGYWGQNGGDSEEDLDEYCGNSKYHIIVLGFVDEFFSEKNKWLYPGINLSKHCAWTPNKNFPRIPQCSTALRAGVKKCQDNGKRVYISMGGATTNYGIENKDRAVTLAKRIWDLFLGGTGDGYLRPFGEIKLDGVDLDIEHIKYKDYDGYPLFAKTLHDLFTTDPSKSYYLTGAPQCPYPDENMKGVLNAAGHLFDELYIQYYNNPPCYPRSTGFMDNFRTWIKLVENTKLQHPDSNLKKILIGLPAAKGASGKDEYYHTPEEVVKIYKQVESFEEFGGFMLWDLGYDESNKIYGHRYSYHIDQILQIGEFKPDIPETPKKANIRNKVVAMWGQNGGDSELDLLDYCKQSAYDTIVIGFINKFFDSKNKYSYPGINLSKHCGWTPHKDFPTLFQCPQILNSAISTCQGAGKKVLISLGGSVNTYNGIPSDEDARKLANRIWNLFLGGTGEESLRPFGSVVFDGINLDIEYSNKNYNGYPKFVETIYTLIQSDYSRSYYITGSPQCTYPDTNMEKVLNEQGHLFDELYIQYFNNYCYPGNSLFRKNFLKWVTFVRDINRQNKESNLKKILIGLPAHVNASDDKKYYKTPLEVKSIVNDVKSFDEFGGFAIWDAGYDELNRINELRYSTHLKSILKNPDGYDPDTTPPPPTVFEKKRIVGYWGQNGGESEKALEEYCKNSVYDIIIIGFVHKFFDIANSYSYPGLNLARHCTTKMSATYPGLLRCPSIGSAIKTCQKNKKKVLISMGGATETYGIRNDESAKKLAKRMWNIFLGGTGEPGLRPFGDAVLDGVDLDIEHRRYEPYDGYPLFTEELHKHMNEDSTKKYLITGAPQCPYPDMNMKGALSDTGHLFDEIYIQYYNNPGCAPSSDLFLPNFDKWVKHLRKIKAKYPNSNFKKIFVGLPTHSWAAIRSGNFYKKPDALRTIYHTVASYPEFGGFMLWDIGWDTQNKEVNNKPYSYAVLDVLNTNGGPKPKGLPTLPPLTTFHQTCNAIEKRKMVVQWGQNGGGNENVLTPYCNKPSVFDTIIIGYVNKFFDDRNKNKFPSLDLTKHCTISSNVREYPFLYKCEDIALAINTCQSLFNKKILISLGGPTEDYKAMKNEKEAKEFAIRIWNLFLGGTDYEELRPFGKMIIDGINLDISHKEKYDGYPVFIQTLYDLMSKSPRRFYITGSPQCEFPYKPMTSVLNSKGHLFDELYVQYYNEKCYPGSIYYTTNVQLWRDFARERNKLKTNGCLKVYIGIPAHEDAVDERKYFNTLKDFRNKVFDYDIRRYPEIGGIMLKDAGFDDLSKKNDKRYSFHIKQVLKRYDPKQTTIAPTTTALITTQPPKDKFKMAGFWGSNRAGASGRGEQGLAHYCSRKSYDIIIINTLTVFYDSRNENLYPGLDFSKHCIGKFGKTYQTYLRCPKMTEWIKQCQKKGKKIVLSIGGGTRFNGFYSKENAELFAKNLWNLFLGGTDVRRSLRTFQRVVLDGININVHNGEASYYPDFVRKLREYMDSDPKKDYLLTASPKCTYPNRIMDASYQKYSRKFDYFFVDFDEKSCSAKERQGFRQSVKRWLSFPGPELFFTIPAHEKSAVSKEHYLSRTDVNVFIKSYINSNPRIRGIALDDVGWDDRNMKNKQRYSDYIGKQIKPVAYTKKKTDDKDKKNKKKKSNAIRHQLGLMTTVFAVLLCHVIRIYGR